MSQVATPVDSNARKSLRIEGGDVMHQRDLLLRIVACGAALFLIACKGGGSGSPTQPSSTSTPATVTSVSISGSTTFTGTNQSTQLAAVATMSDNSTRNVTDQSVWQSSNAAVASVSGTGLVTSIGFGQADITATHQGMRGTTAVLVQNTCSYTLSETAVTFGSNGGSRTLGVSTSAASCAWTAATDSSWITIASGGSGSGSGTITYSIAANSATAARDGRLTVGNQGLTVRQEGVATGSGSCPDPNGAAYQYCVSPVNRSVGFSGGTFSLTITTNRPDATWTATSDQSWVRIVGTRTATGPGVTSYVVDSNPFGFERVANITVAGLSGLYPPGVHTIRQAPR